MTQRCMTDKYEFGALKLNKARVLFVGLGGLCSEVLKNVVLAGIGSVTLAEVDGDAHPPVSREDLAAQIFLRESDVGANRALASAPRIRAMSINCEVLYDPRPLADILQASKAKDVQPTAGEPTAAPAPAGAVRLCRDSLAQYGALCATGCPFPLQVALDEYCHARGVAFFTGDSFGTRSFFFCDFGPAMTCLLEQPGGGASAAALPAAAPGAPSAAAGPARAESSTGSGAPGMERHPEKAAAEAGSAAAGAGAGAAAVIDLVADEDDDLAEIAAPPPPPPPRQAAPASGAADGGASSGPRARPAAPTPGPAPAAGSGSGSTCAYHFLPLGALWGPAARATPGLPTWTQALPPRPRLLRAIQGPSRPLSSPPSRTLSAPGWGWSEATVSDLLHGRAAGWWRTAFYEGTALLGRGATAEGLLEAANALAAQQGAPAAYFRLHEFQSAPAPAPPRLLSPPPPRLLSPPPTLLRTHGRDLSPVCAVAGGFLSQEIIRAFSRKGVPLRNMFTYDAALVADDPDFAEPPGPPRGRRNRPPNTAGAGLATVFMPPNTAADGAPALLPAKHPRQ
ncbi:putative ubiquitin-like 1-activating enzyme E1 A [Paratrimastix pyriformis]|uniref:Ubiquitin-like 1-activating enzyme E1 A n=1 Tax=Paratrimastix pyriformis TaxID=342808 RepID=A0ABQ8UAK3_9EUKA|nr:putative ubiquitin-like 1-activating enzyme E1 A [Paratrimastix pyriformis]